MSCNLEIFSLSKDIAQVQHWHCLNATITIARHAAKKKPREDLVESCKIGHFKAIMLFKLVRRCLLLHQRLWKV